MSVFRALHARVLWPAGGHASALGSTRPPGLTPAPPPLRAAGHCDWPSAPSQPSPLPPQPPARPRSPLSPAVPARPRRAALCSHWLRAPLCGGSCGPSAFECREGPGREPFHGPSVSPPAAAPPPPAPRAPPPAPAAPATPPPPAPAPGSRATKGPRAAATAAARGARMVLVHVGYLVLPVFGSVRNRGIAFSFRGPLRSVDRRRHRGGGGGGGGRRGRLGSKGTPGGNAGQAVASSLSLLGGSLSVEATALVGAFVAKLGFGESPAPFFILCGGRSSSKSQPLPLIPSPV